MTSFDSLVNIYLVVVFGLAAVALLASVGVVATTIATNRRARLSSRQSMRTYYGRLALHH